MEAEEPMTVDMVNNPCEAEVIKTALQGQGVSCQWDGERQAGLSNILEIGALVRTKDADRARMSSGPTNCSLGFWPSKSNEKRELSCHK
jgi:hypothetical protein